MSKGSQIKTLNHGKVRIGSNWWKVEYFDRANKEATLVSNGKVMSGREAFEALSFLPKWVEPVMEVAVGMPFIFRQNDPDKKWVNGSIGYVHTVDVENNTLTIDLDGDLVEVKPETCESKEYDNKNLPTKEYRGILGHSAFALTVQKTQGLTLYTNVEVNFNTKVIKGMNLSGLVYVALSRVTSIENLSIKVDGKSQKAAINSLNKDLIVADSMAVKLRQKAKKELKNLDVKLVASKTKEFSITAVEDNQFTLTSKEQKVVFHKDSDTFDLITSEGTQNGLYFSALPEEVQSELTELFNLNYEAKRVIKTIPEENWATTEPSPFIEVLDDNIVIYDSEGNELPINIGTASEDRGEGGLDLGKHEVNFDKTYWVELINRVEQVQLNCGVEFGQYKFPSGKNLAIFDSLKDIKDFAELLNQYPDSIKEILESDVMYWAYIDKKFEPVSDVTTEAGGDKDDEFCEETENLKALLDEEFCEETENLKSLLDEEL
jgi:hypothetical protein